MSTKFVQMMIAFEPIIKISKSLRQKPHEKTGENWSSGFREEDA